MENNRNFLDSQWHSEKLENFLNEWLINEESRLFLSSEIDRLNSDWNLSDEENIFLNKQVEYHNRFNNILENYNQYKQNISINWRKELQRYFDSMNSNYIEEFDLQFITNKIDNSVNFIRETNYWREIIAQLNRFIEIRTDVDDAIVNQSNIDDFYDIFWFYYSQSLSKNNSDIYNSENESWLLLEENEIENIINNIFRNYRREFINLKYPIYIRLQDWETYTINTQEIINKIGNSEEITKKLSLLDEILHNNNEALEEVRISENLRWNTREEIISEYSKKLLDDWIINTSNILEIYENSENFNYLEFLNNYWFTENLEFTYAQMIQRQLINETQVIWDLEMNEEFVAQNYQNIINNFEVFTKIVLEIESNWRNVANNSWSSARWYFQYLTENSSGWWRAEWKFTSIETALRRYYLEYTWMQYIPNIRLEHSENVPEWIVDFYNWWNMDTRNLSAEQQNELFIIDLFTNNKRINSPWWQILWIDHFLWLVAVGNTDWITTAYKNFHHTASDNQTDQVFERVLNKYSGELIALN